MIIEKLDAIASRISGLIRKGEITQALQGVFDALNNYINAPNEGHLQAVTAALDALRARVNADGWRAVPRTWLLYLDEIGFTPYLGENLYRTVRDGINFSNMSAVQARDEVGRIRGEIEKYVGAFDQITAASKILKIEKDKLAPGDAELGVLLPRGLFDNQLSRFAAQSKELDALARLFEELATGSRESPKIRAISTTDPTYFLLVSPAAALFFLKALNMLLDAYEKVLRIRKLRAEIASTLSPALTGQIEQEAQGQVQAAINSMVPRLLEESVVSGDRRNELRNELEIRLPRIASWIDRGVRIEATIQPLPLKKDGEEESEDVANLRNLSQQIAELSAQIRRYELAGEPILNLPPPDNDDDE